MTIYIATTIDTILDRMQDRGPGPGARYHHRVSRAETLRLIRAGAEATDCPDFP